MTAAEQLDRFVRDVRAQIHVAEDRGAEHDDLCIVVPASYLAMAAGWPTLELDGEVVAVVPKLWARDLCDKAIAETSWQPPLDVREPGGGGLWGFTSGVGSSLKDLKGAKPSDFTDPGRLF